jgi:hypothetical protein
MSHVTTENFWESYENARRQAYKDAWSDNKTKTVVATIQKVLSRLILSYIFFPPATLFTLFLLDSWSFGMVEVANTVLAALPNTATEGEMYALLKAWLISGTLIFAVFAILTPWGEPVGSIAEKTMNDWWKEHSHLMGLTIPVTEPKNKSEDKKTD